MFMKLPELIFWLRKCMKQACSGSGGENLYKLFK